MIRFANNIVLRNAQNSTTALVGTHSTDKTSYSGGEKHWVPNMAKRQCLFGAVFYNAPKNMEWNNDTIYNNIWGGI